MELIVSIQLFANDLDIMRTVCLKRMLNVNTSFVFYLTQINFVNSWITRFEYNDGYQVNWTNLTFDDANKC